MPHKGLDLPIPVADDVLIWDWLFHEKISPLRGIDPVRLGGFRDAVTGQRFSYKDLKDHATAVSAVFAQDYGLKAGDNIAVIADNSIWYPVAVFAGLRLGLQVSAVAPGYGAEELSYLLETASSKLLVVDPGSEKAAVGAAKQTGIPLSSIVAINTDSKHRSLQQLVDRGRNLQAPEPYRLGGNQQSNKVCAFLSFSSGTTGRPKAVMISHRNVIAQAYQVLDMTRPGPAQILLGVLPLCHITGVVHILQLPILLNQEVILMSSFNMKVMLDTIVKYQCQELWMVPPLLIRLVNDSIVNDYDLSGVKQFNTGAAPLAVEVIAKLAQKFPKVAIRQAWGMTESCSCITITPLRDQTYANAHTVGKIAAGTELKIIDPESGSELPFDAPGEILARGPQITMGYLNNKKATDETYDSEGYLHTGDLGSIDEKGFITIHDRIKELIKVKGIGVAPAELEDLLLGHPNVTDAAVVAKPDSYSGEVPRAFVVLKAGTPRNAATEKLLQDYVKERKTRSKWITGGVAFLDEIPKSASGKILRRMLRDKVREEEKAKAKL